jgi:hypothetical protein
MIECSQPVRYGDAWRASSRSIDATRRWTE